MDAAKDAAVTRPEKSRVLAPRLRNKERTRTTMSTELFNIAAAQELDIDEKLERLESRVRELRRLVIRMFDERSMRAEVAQLRARRDFARGIRAPEPSQSESASSCITRISAREAARIQAAPSDLGEALP